MSLKVVSRPFKSAGVFYPVGSIIEDPTAIKLYKTKVKDKKIIDVDEHNVDDVSYYLLAKHGVDVKGKLKEALSPSTVEYTEEYIAKVYKLADKYDVQTENRSIEDLIKEIKQKQAESK